MFGVIFTVLRSLGAVFRPRRQLLLENLALRHQLLVLNRNAGKPKFSHPDRLLWVCLRAFWSGWQKALVIVRPQTVIGWHRAGFRLYWRRKSHSGGRPPIGRELIRLIRRMAEVLRGIQSFSMNGRITASQVATRLPEAVLLSSLSWICVLFFSCSKTLTLN